MKEEIREVKVVGQLTFRGHKVALIVEESKFGLIKGSVITRVNHETWDRMRIPKRVCFAPGRMNFNKWVVVL
jgi:hypothetical protein